MQIAYLSGSLAGLYFDAIQACRRYQLSQEELLAWEIKFKSDGTPALRTTRVQQYRRLSLP